MSINQDGLLIDDLFPQVLAQAQLNSPTMPLRTLPMGMPLPVANAATSMATQIPQAQGPPPVPKDADSRADLWRNLFADFVWSLGSSMSASAKAPPGQRHVAAFGAALNAPFQRRVAEAGLQQTQQRTANLEAAIENMMNGFRLKSEGLDLQSKKVDAQMKDFQSLAGQRTANTNLANARADTENATRDSKVAKNRLITTNNGLFDTQTRSVVPGTAPTSDIPITAELVQENPDIPSELIGHSIKSGELARYLKPDTSVVSTDDAVQLIDKADGRVIRVIGKPRPVAGPQAPVVVTTDPDNPNRQVVSTLDRKNNSLTPVVTGSGANASKLTPAASNEFTKLDKESRDANTGLSIIKDLAAKAIREPNRASAYDQDILLRYFDVAAPAVGRRMNQAELDRLVSIGTLPERARVWFSKFTNREAYDPETRKAIIDSLESIVSQKNKAFAEFKTSLGGNGTPPTPTRRPATVEDLK